MSYIRLGLGSLFLMTATVAIAQETVPRTQEQATAAFIERKTNEQRERAQRSVAPNELRELNGMVRAIDVVLPHPSAIDNPVQLEAIRNLYLVDIAQGLASYGFKPGDLRSSADGGSAIVEAMGNTLRGTASVDDYLMLADTVFVGTKQSETNQLLDDQHRTTVGFQITREIKVPPNLKDTIDLRRRSGAGAGGENLRISTEVPLEDGQSYLIIGSRSLYQSEFSGNRGQCKNCIVELIPALVVDGDRATSTAPPSFNVDLSSL